MRWAGKQGARWIGVFLSTAFASFFAFWGAIETFNKDSPLWKKYSKVIYWWTSMEVDDNSAYRIAWNGQVQPTRKEARWGYLAYRCVR